MATAPPPEPPAAIDRPDPRLPATHLDPVVARPGIGMPGRLVGLATFAAATLVYALIGYHVTVDQHVVVFDALDRLTRAYQVWYDDPPKLAAIGFSFPPITTLVLLPLALIKPLASGLVALPLTSAFFAGLTIVLLDRTLARCEMPAFLRIPILLLYAANPMTVFYAGNGMSEAVYVALLAFSLYAAVSWYETTEPRYLFGGGFGFALLLLTRYGFILWAVLLILLIGFALLGRQAHRIEVEGSIVAFAAPAVYALVLWCLFNALIVGDPFGWLATNTNQGVNAAGISSPGNLGLLHIVGRLIRVTADVFPLGFAAVPAALGVFFVRRDAMGLWLASLVILGLAIMGVHAATAHREGLLTLRDAMPMALTAIVAAAWAFRSLSGLRTAVWGITVVLLIIGLFTAWQAMESYPFQSLEQAFIRAAKTGADQERTNSIGGFTVGISSEAEMANYVNRTIHGRHAILTDNSQTFGVILLSGRPRLFFDRVIKGDGTWQSVLRDPYGVVQYMLVAYNPRGGDLIRAHYPALLSGRPAGFKVLYQTDRYVLVKVPGLNPNPAVTSTTAKSNGSGGLVGDEDLDPVVRLMTQPPQTRQPPWPPKRPAGDDGPVYVASELTDSVAARVQDILASAHETAESVREQAAAATREMIAQAQATVDRDTERIRRDVEARAAQYLAECHRRVDAFADARVRRLRELSDSLIEQTDALNERFDQVVRLQEQLNGLIAALGGAAEQTAREVRRPAISLPTVAQFHGETGGLLRERGPVVEPSPPAAPAERGAVPAEVPGPPRGTAPTPADPVELAGTPEAVEEEETPTSEPAVAPGTEGHPDRVDPELGSPPDEVEPGRGGPASR